MVSEIDVNDEVIGIVGLGYVGWPLLKEFEKHLKVIGFDVNQQKVEGLKHKVISAELTTDAYRLKEASIVIIAVPTPILTSKQPDLSYVISACKLVGSNLKNNAIVVLESTVYPGVTEDIMGPVLEKQSGMILGSDFFMGYSPERVNPGDNEHTIDKITKIVSGMNTETADRLAAVYGLITKVYKAENIKTAEAAKVIENVQRDLNIALTNELSLIFHKLGIDTNAVLDAAATKWNFNRFTPGLVGGHCIPVDPYYLVYKAQEIGYHPQVILAGRAVNDSMPKHVADLTIKAFNNAGKVMNGSKVLIMGLTFKENVDDTRETPVKHIIKELKEFKCQIFGYDPLLSREDIESFGITAVDSYNVESVDCVIVSVVHDEFKQISLSDLKNSMKESPILIDVRGFFKHAKDHGFSYHTL
ncbi:UDP-N-acetyl-D-galactosamine dehydrogenase [Thermoplasmatales archaeon ex4572_165]|nr:MAG: UDP-N-acetyl-D-galactosamine dehydrogenase [Thermoplasmatales archaeon ex4572_165]